MNLQEVRELFTDLSQDPIRVAKEKIWQRSERQYHGYLPQRVDSRGGDLSKININLTNEMVNLLVDAVYQNILQAENIVSIVPDDYSSELATRLVGNVIDAKIKRIKSLKANLKMIALHYFNQGFGVGKFVNKPEWKVYWISPQDIYIENATDFEEVNYIIHKVHYNKEQVEAEKDWTKEGKEVLLKTADYIYPVGANYESMTEADLIRKEKANCGFLEIHYRKDGVWWIKQVGMVECAYQNNVKNLIEYPIFELDEYENPDWGGHPFVFGSNEMDFRSLYGVGKGEKQRNFQTHFSMVLNNIIDYLIDSIKLPILMEEDAMDNESSLVNMLNSKQGSVVKINPMGSGKISYLQKPVINPQTFSVLNILENYANKQLGFSASTLAGEQGQHREAATALLARLQESAGKLKNEVMGFYEQIIMELAEKMIFDLFQYRPTNEINTFSGKENGYIKIIRGNELHAEKVPPLVNLSNEGKSPQIEKYDETNPLHKGKKVHKLPHYILQLPHSKSDAEKFLNLTVGSDTKDKLNIVDSNNINQYLQNVGSLLAIAPEIRAGLNIADMLNDMGYNLFGKHKNYFSQEKIDEFMKKQQGQLPNQNKQPEQGAIASNNVVEATANQSRANIE